MADPPVGLRVVMQAIMFGEPQRLDLLAAPWSPSPKSHEQLTCCQPPGSAVYQLGAAVCSS